MAPGRLLKSFAENADAVIESEPCTSGNRTIGSAILWERKTTHAPKAETKKRTALQTAVIHSSQHPLKKKSGGEGSVNTPHFFGFGN